MAVRRAAAACGDRRNLGLGAAYELLYLASPFCAFLAAESIRERPGKPRSAHVQAAAG